MTDINSGFNPLFLREEDIRQGIELLYFAYRDFTAEPDAILSEYGFGARTTGLFTSSAATRASTSPNYSAILKITKQSCHAF